MSFYEAIKKLESLGFLMSKSYEHYERWYHPDTNREVILNYNEKINRDAANIIQEELWKKSLN